MNLAFTFIGEMRIKKLEAKKGTSAYTVSNFYVLESDRKMTRSFDILHFVFCMEFLPSLIDEKVMYVFQCISHIILLFDRIQRKEINEKPCFTSKSLLFPRTICLKIFEFFSIFEHSVLHYESE